MKRAMRVLTAMVVIAVFACAIVAPAFAKDEAKDAVKAVVQYPANVVSESVQAVGTAAENTAGMVNDTVKATGETLTGDVTKAPEIVTTPVTESANTVAEAAKDTIEVPVKAAEQK